MSHIPVSDDSISRFLEEITDMQWMKLPRSIILNPLYRCGDNFDRRWNGEAADGGDCGELILPDSERRWQRHLEENLEKRL